ncbi:MAG: SpoIIE family protein phosphatase, partial [Lachnospiraceae bacterium]|nr:SpoIIE family protein phosphatase [Lachnospiraceae bacterium]
LYDGDMIIMVSDGVIDQIEAEDKEGYIKELLLAMDTNNPQELVSGLLETISLESQGNLRDDMTALCIGVWKK